MSSEYASQAGAFAMLLMQRYIDDVHAASYPQTPQEVGGPTYKFFKSRYEDLADHLKDSSLSKAEIGDRAIQAIRDYLSDDSLSGEAARSFSLSMDTAYRHFSSRIEIIDRLEAGEKAQDILNNLRGKDMDDDHGFPQIQSPQA